MAPSAPSNPPTTAPLMQTIQTFYNLLVCASDHRGPSTEAAMISETSNLHSHLLTLSQAARTLNVDLPPDVVGYVQDGRNPDIYTREFAELTQKNNQLLKGKQEAFARFAVVLGREIGGAVPELRGPVRDVLGKGLTNAEEIVWEGKEETEEVEVKVKEEGDSIG